MAAGSNVAQTPLQGVPARSGVKSPKKVDPVAPASAGCLKGACFSLMTKLSSIKAFHSSLWTFLFSKTKMTVGSLGASKFAPTDMSKSRPLPSPARKPKSEAKHST